MAGGFHIRTFGCQMNVHDSRRMEALLVAAGWTPLAQPEGADLVVVNTCSVREKAYQKVRGAVGKLRPLGDPDRGGPAVVCVAGCVARQEAHRWLEIGPHVDIVLGPDAVGRIVEHVEAIMDGSPPIVDVEFDPAHDVRFLSRPGGGSGASAYVTIMKGCSHRCSFCIVPSVRGPMRYRPSREILAEVQDLVARGVREVTLLGQTVNAWRERGVGDFAWLLRALDGLGIARLRYTSPHPIYFGEALVAAHGDLSCLCEHVHLPLQSGSDRVLGRMRRRHDRSRYLEVARALQAARPGFSLSTDLIVGFPGETREDFEKTCEVVETVGFDTFFSFMYSARPGTRAAGWEDDVPSGTKHARLETLHDLGREITARRFAGDLGRRVEVLVEGPSRSGEGQMTGRTRTNRIVNFEAGRAQPGDLLDVRIRRVLPHCLLGDRP